MLDEARYIKSIFAFPVKPRTQKQNA